MSQRFKDPDIMLSRQLYTQVWYKWATSPGSPKASPPLPWARSSVISRWTTCWRSARTSIRYYEWNWTRSLSVGASKWPELRPFLAHIGLESQNQGQPKA